MTGFTESKVSKILESVIGSDTFVALFVGEPNDSGSGSEPPTSAGYMRANFGTTSVSGRTITNAATIFFEESVGGPYGTVTHVGLCDDSTGPAFFVGKLTNPEDIEKDRIPVFRKGALSISLDKKS